MELMPITEFVRITNKSEVARQLDTSRQMIQFWCNSTKPVYVCTESMHVFRKLK